MRLWQAFFLYKTLLNSNKNKKGYYAKLFTNVVMGCMNIQKPRWQKFKGQDYWIT